MGAATTPITLDTLQAAMAAEDTEINSAIAFIVSVPGLVAAAAANAGIDQTKAAAMVADFTAQTNAIAAALITGTPAASAPVPAPSTTAPTTPASAPTPEVASAAATAVANMKKKLGIK